VRKKKLNTSVTSRHVFYEDIAVETHGLLTLAE